MKRLAILQSNYIPWKGYFDIIASVDEFMILDDVQYTTRDWRNRNKIKTNRGVKWVSIPVTILNRHETLINQVNVVDDKWSEDHWNKISIYYKNAPYWGVYNRRISELYEKAGELQKLSEINLFFIKNICNIFYIDTKITSSSHYKTSGQKLDRILSLCESAGASQYLSGPAANSYLDVNRFEQAGIELELANYQHYLEYHQLHPPFEHGVSILDMIFNLGPNAYKYLYKGMDLKLGVKQVGTSGE